MQPEYCPNQGKWKFNTFSVVPPAKTLGPGYYTIGSPDGKKLLSWKKDATNFTFEDKNAAGFYQTFQILQVGSEKPLLVLAVNPATSQFYEIMVSFKTCSDTAVTLAPDTSVSGQTSVPNWYLTGTNIFMVSSGSNAPSCEVYLNVASDYSIGFQGKGQGAKEWIITSTSAPKPTTDLTAGIYAWSVDNDFVGIDSTGNVAIVKSPAYWLYQSDFTLSTFFKEGIYYLYNNKGVWSLTSSPTTADKFYFTLHDSHRYFLGASSCMSSGSTKTCLYATTTGISCGQCYYQDGTHNSLNTFTPVAEPNQKSLPSGFYQISNTENSQCLYDDLTYGTCTPSYRNTWKYQSDSMQISTPGGTACISNTGTCNFPKIEIGKCTDAGSLGIVLTTSGTIYDTKCKTCLLPSTSTVKNFFKTAGKSKKHRRIVILTVLLGILILFLVVLLVLYLVQKRKF